MKVNFNPIKTVKSLYYANRPMRTYRKELKVLDHMVFPSIEEPSFWEKLKNTFDLIFKNHRDL